MKLLHQAWLHNAALDWIWAGLIALFAVIAIALLRLAVVRTAGRFRGKAPLGAVADVAAVTKLWLLLPVALYAGATALELPSKLERLAELLAVVALMLQAALWINCVIARWLEKQIESKRGQEGDVVTVLGLLGFVARSLVWVLIVLTILNQLNVDITALVTGLGIGGVAVALAVQNVLGDLFASLSIVLDKPFVVGDFIVVGDALGTVENIGLKTTRVRSLSGELIVFSNGDLLKSRIHNYKRMYQRRVLFSFGVTFDTPVEKLERIPAMVREAVEARDSTRFDRAHFKEYGDSALAFEAVYFVLSADYNTFMDIQQDVNLELFRGFAREGIQFAFPTRTVHIAAPSAPEAARERREHAGHGSSIAG